MTDEQRQSLARDLRALATQIEKGTDITAEKPRIRVIAEGLLDGINAPKLARTMLANFLK